MAKRIVTFKLEEHVYLRLKQLALEEGRTPSDIIRVALNAHLATKVPSEKPVAASPVQAFPEVVESIRKMKAEGQSWARIGQVITTRHRVVCTKEQLKALAEGVVASDDGSAIGD